KIPLISHIMLNVMSGSGGGTVNGAILIVLDKVIHKLIVSLVEIVGRNIRKLMYWDKFSQTRCQTKLVNDIFA
ncbi:9885_t:CDS:1, partial [Entrophospora sp. SA101]